MNSSGKEGHNPYVELSGERKLREGQNFYDQQPFVQAVQEGVDSSGIPHEAVRFTLTHLSRKLDGVDVEDSPWEKNKLILNLFSSLSNYGSKNIQNYINNSTGRTVYRPEFRNGVRVALFSLRDYPYWVDYVSTQNSNDQYLTDGTFQLRSYTSMDRAAMFLSTDTYIEWLTKKVERNRKIGILAIQVVLDETFPDQKFSQALLQKYMCHHRTLDRK